MVVAKNKDTRKYDVIPFFADASGNVKELNLKSYSDEPKFKSCHLNNGNIILMAHDDKTLFIVDYEIGTGVGYNKIVEDFTEPIGFFSDSDRTIILHPEYKGDRLIIEDIKNGSEITSVPVKMTDEIKKEIKLLKRQGMDQVNTQEYVKNGSIRSARIYYEGNAIIITHDDKSNHTTNTININIATGDANFKTFKVSDEKYKQITSFVKEDLLFIMNSSKDNMDINTYALSSGEKKASYNLTRDLMAYFNPKTDMDVETYLKKAHKVDMKTTLTINKSGENYTMRVDAVNSKNYNYNWWFNKWWHMHMHMQMMMQQQMMMNQQMRMHQQMMRGPNADFTFLPPYTEQADFSFTITLDSNLKLIDKADVDTSDYPEIDKSTLTKQFAENKEIKHFSASFNNTAMRYVFIVKDSNEIMIDNITYNL